jgi:hypothetical protein
MRTLIMGCFCLLSIIYFCVISPFSQPGYYQIANNKAMRVQYIKVTTETVDLIGPDFKSLKAVRISGKKNNYWVGSEDSISGGLHVYSFTFEPSSIRWYPQGVYFKVIDPFKLVSLISKNK